MPCRPAYGAAWAKPGPPHVTRILRTDAIPCPGLFSSTAIGHCGLASQRGASTEKAYSIYIYTQFHMYMYIYIYIMYRCMCIYIYIYIYVCVYMCVRVSLFYPCRHGIGSPVLRNLQKAPAKVTLKWVPDVFDGCSALVLLCFSRSRALSGERFNMVQSPSQPFCWAVTPN